MPCVLSSVLQPTDLSITGTEDVNFYKTEIYGGYGYLIDTPGFDEYGTGNQTRKDREILYMIFDELTKLYHGDKLVKGLIYLYDIRQEKIGGVTFNVSRRLPIPRCSLSCSSTDDNFIESKLD